jgi:hypothetical protein
VSDRAETRVRAYPIPADDQLDADLRALIDDSKHECEILELDGIGRVLVIDDKEAADGIHAYDELLDALHEQGVNVFAQNLDNPHGIRARREFRPAGGSRRSWWIDPVTLETLIGITDIEAAAKATATAEELLAMVRTPELPDWLLEVHA